MKFLPRRLALASALLAVVAALGCSVDSADEFIRDVPVNFSGFYVGRNNGNIVSANNGKPITTLDLRQSGDSLEAVDNNGRIWRGSLGEVQDGSSSFELNGQTTDGTEATFSGTISSSDGGSSETGSVSNAEGTMQGTYIEPDRFATFYATASIPGSSDNGGSGNLSVGASPSTITSTNGTSTLSVSGGSGSYTWTTPSKGTLSSTTGSSVTYNRNGASSGNVTISVKDSEGLDGSVTLNLQ